MDDTQRIVKCGTLSLHTPGGFFKKRWHSKYLVLYDGSKSGVKRLELFDSEIKFKKQNPAKIIPLVDCVRVVTCQRQKTTYTFEVRMSDQFYLLAGQSFQDMNDWVNCLRLVAFGQQQQPTVIQPTQLQQQRQQQVSKRPTESQQRVDILLEKRGPLPAVVASAPVVGGPLPKKLPSSIDQQQKQEPVGGRITTASQAAVAAASALAKSRQRQPSLLGTCKPQPPTDSPFIQRVTTDPLAGQLDTMTPSMRGQLIASSATAAASDKPTIQQRPTAKAITIQATLDEEEENMLYCSIEDNPSEHNYRVKVIETELSLRCQLKCYQLTAPTTISQQYEQIGNFNTKSGAYSGPKTPDIINQPPITFYQLIIGPQELTLLNDYAISSQKLTTQGLLQQQGLWSWPYQCIRRYGFDKDNCFMFEAGRKCTSGPGQFIVQTPKAYSIYQDVVKFVNELRSLNTNQQPDSTVNVNKSTNQLAQAGANPGQKSVTQIPVTWAPNSNPTNESAPIIIPDSSIDLRQQFFDTLRQMDNTTVQQTPVPPASNTKLTSMNNNNIDENAVGKDLLKSTTARQVSNSSPDSVDTVSSNNVSSQNNTKQQKCSDLSDESGYDQGDDSVDSGKQRSKAIGSGAGQIRKRQQMNDESMSSSSSSNSSDGSPGHSVSRRSLGSVGIVPLNGPVSRRTPLVTDNKLSLSPSKQEQKQQPSITTKSFTRTPNQSNTNDSKNLSRMHNLLLSDCLDQADDFETSLIRDVYSEISKLHAEFAITNSHSTEDSMSSSSSSDRLGQDDDSNNDADFSNNTNKNGRMTIAASEPMYSNLKFPRARHSNQRQIDEPDDGRRRRIDMHQTDHSQYQRNYNIHNGSYPQQQNHNFEYTCSRQMYPTILNPIPECGEPQGPAVSRPLDSDRQVNKHSYSQVSGSLEGSDRAFRHQNQSHQAAGLSGLLRSKQPTNHYVINDVQYAKISKNNCSKY